MYIFTNCVIFAMAVTDINSLNIVTSSDTSSKLNDDSNWDLTTTPRQPEVTQQDQVVLLWLVCRQVI